MQAVGPDDAGATAGGIVGGVVRAGEESDDSTTTSTAATATTPPPDTATTATTPPPPTTQRTTPQTTPQTIITPDTSPRVNPSVVGPEVLSPEAREIYNLINGMGGPLAVEVGLTNSAQTQVGRMASSGSLSGSSNLLNESGQPWPKIHEEVGNGSDIEAVKNYLAGKGGAFSGYQYVGVATALGSDGLLYVDIRLARG